MRFPAKCVSGFIAVSLAAATTSRATAAVEVGQKAPSLTIKTWVNGKPVKLAEGRGKTVYVVEFWATWCGPCKQSIPHLSALQKRFADSEVVIVGITDESAQTVRTWLAREKEIKMDYWVACDQARKTTSTYLERGDGIPHAFVVDTTGVVVWEGHPMMNMDGVLERVLAGTFDPKLEAKKQGIRDRAMTSLRGGDMAGGLGIVDELIAADAADPGGYELKLQVLGYLGKSAEARTLRGRMATTFAENPRVLTDLAAHYATAQDLADRDPRQAVQLATRAVELTDSKVVRCLNTQARAYYAMCQIDKAIAAQKAAVAAAEGEEKKSASLALEYYHGIKSASVEAPSGD